MIYIGLSQTITYNYFPFTAYKRNHDLISGIWWKPHDSFEHEEMRFPHRDKAWGMLHHHCFFAQVSKRVNYRCPRTLENRDACIGWSWRILIKMVNPFSFFKMSICKDAQSPCPYSKFPETLLSASSDGNGDGRQKQCIAKQKEMFMKTCTPSNV